MHKQHSNPGRAQKVMEDEVIKDVEAIFEGTEDGKPLPECCIYRVPHTIRDQNPEAYTPKVVSIGPIHRDNERLKGMERHKQVFFKTLVQKAQVGLRELVRSVISLEPQVRASYSDNIELNKKEFVKLILVDAAFIIELFMIVYKDKDKDHKGVQGGYMFLEEDEISKVTKMLPPWSLDGTAKDLLLLENQLPFFVIEKLFKTAFPISFHSLSFRGLAYRFFESNSKQIPPNIEYLEIKHITDLLRLSFLSGRTSGKAGRLKSFIGGPRDLLLYSATELQEFGVRLKASTSSDKCLLNMKFTRPKIFNYYLRSRRPILEIPEIFLEDRTEILFRNMIALEQCHYQFESYITDYAFVLDCLINGCNDVDVLTHGKIIHNFLGDTNSVATLFNGLRKNIIGESISSDYHNLCKELNKYCEGNWNQRMASLKRDYCKTAWHTMATSAAIVVIILTLGQTILSVLQIVLK